MTNAPKILLLDDEPNILVALRRTLSREGYQVTACGTPEEAFEALHRETFDIIMTDHIMPRMTGLEFLRVVRLRYPEPMRIMLTGQADMQTAIDAINLGEIFRFLTKPWDDAELKATLFAAMTQLEEQREQRRLLTLARVGHLRSAGA
jgi:DNA-binding NtrC family response regulator